MKVWVASSPANSHTALEITWPIGSGLPLNIADGLPYGKYHIVVQ